MKTKQENSELENKVSQGLAEAYRKMAEFKKRNNSPLIVSRNGKVVSIPADQIPPTTSQINDQ
ncbi:MAG: hypothetical protein JXR10_13740 [Cyclobacteriaceae bacterium]